MNQHGGRRTRRAIAAAAIGCIASVIASGAHAATTGLPPGQHTAVLKYWSEGPWRVTNYTPFEFDGRIDSLTPDTDHGLWFSVGTSIEHIDSLRALTTIQMPEPLWIVSGIAIANRQTWFTAGQSGKVGIVDPDGRVHFIQVVPRRNFPDLRDLFVNPAGEMWFVDFGRSSVGYRSSSGRVVENPFTVSSVPVGENPYNRRVYPIRMAHCMGKFWVATRGPTGSELNVIDENLRPHPFFIDRPKLAQFEDIACDTSDRLWIVLTDFRHGVTLERFDAGGHFKTIVLAGFNGASMAADRSGGMWLIGSFDRQPRRSIVHIDSRSAMTTRILPVVAYAQLPIVVDADQRLWVGIDFGGSPIAVTELEPALVVK